MEGIEHFSGFYQCPMPFAGADEALVASFRYASMDLRMNNNMVDFGRFEESLQCRAVPSRETRINVHGGHVPTRSVAIVVYLKQME